MIAEPLPGTSTRTAATRRAAAEWGALRDRIRTVTPRALARVILAVVVVAGVVELAVASWPALAPFAVGGIIAYVLLPLVDALDRFMPRFLAALISVVAVVALLGGIIVLVVPPLVVTFVALAASLPAPADLEAALDRLQAQLGNLPEGSASLLRPLLDSIATTVQQTLAGASTTLSDLARGAVAALFDAIGALVGLIVLPTWMLAVLTQKRRARVAVDTRVVPWLRRDFWAVAAIVDRAAGSYLRGYVIVGIIVGALTYAALVLSPRVGGPLFQQPAALATIAGVSQVVPIIGPIVGFVPTLLLLPIDPNRAAGYLIAYLGARILGGSVIGGRLMQRRINVPPVILVPGIVMIGQFGVLWLLLSAPIVAIAYDLVRYAYGRFSDPPRPAGVLPGNAVPTTGQTQTQAQGAAPTPQPRYRPMPAPAPLTPAAPSTPAAATPAAVPGLGELEGRPA